MMDEPPVESRDSQQPPSTESTASVSGGVTVDAQRDVNIGGDVVGRDKLTEIIEGDKVAGDKIVEQQITATGRGIAIGKINIPFMPLAAALGLGLAALLLVMFISSRTQQQLQQILPTPTAVKMGGTFNVLVAEFGEQDAAGQVQSTQRGRALGNLVFKTLAAQKDAFPNAAIKTSVELRYDEAAPGGLVIDAATADRAAQRVGAQMVIYGVIDQQGGLLPQFYVVPEARGQISALSAGSFQFGDEPIRFSGDSLFNASTDLQMRASALLYIIMGMTYDFFGRVEQALDVYRRAADQVAWDEKGQGKEVLYFLWGQAALFTQQQSDCRADQSSDAEWRALNAEAKKVFDKALQSNARYTRAMIGLGDVANLRIQCLTSTAEALNAPELSEMFARYEQALGQARAANDGFLENLSTFSLAGAYYLQGAAYRFTKEAANASASFDKALELLGGVEDYFAANNQHRELAQTYLLRAVIDKQYAEFLREQNDRAGASDRYEQARQYYQLCVDQKARAPEDRVLADLVVRDRCQPGLDAVMAQLKQP